MLSGRSQTENAVCVCCHLHGMPRKCKVGKFGGHTDPQGLGGTHRSGLGWVVATPGAPTPSPAMSAADGDCLCLVCLESLEQEPRLGFAGREGGRGCPKHLPLPLPTRSGQPGPCTLSPSPHLCLVPRTGWPQGREQLPHLSTRPHQAQPSAVAYKSEQSPSGALEAIQAVPHPLLHCIQTTWF